MNTNNTSNFVWLEEAMLDEFPGSKVVMRHFDRGHPDMMIPEIAERSPVEQVGLMLRLNGKSHGIRFDAEADFDDEDERQRIIGRCVDIFSPMKNGDPPTAVLGLLMNPPIYFSTPSTYK